MSVSVDDVLDIAPELSDEDSDRVSRFIERASLQVNTDVWGDLVDMGITYLTAHMMTLANRSGTNGTLSKEKVGDLERAYSVPSTSTGFESTTYGAEYLRMRKTLLMTPLVIA